MAEISNRAVGVAAGGAVLAVALAFVSTGDGADRTAVDPPRQTVRDITERGGEAPRPQPPRPSRAR